MNWTPAQDQVIRQLAATCPWDLVVIEYNDWAVHTQNQPPASKAAIVSRAKRLGITADPHGNYTNCRTICAILKRDKRTIWRWLRHCIKPAFIFDPGTPSCTVWIERKGIADLAMRNPELFSTNTYEQLLEATHDPVASQYVVDRCHTIIGGRPVRCQETGITYGSIKQAAEAINTSRKYLSACIREDRPVRGWHFTYI